MGMRWLDGFMRQSLLVVVLSGLGSVLNVAFHMVLGRALPPAEYGALVALLGITLVVAMPLQAVQNTLAHYGSVPGAERVGPLMWRWVRRIGWLGVALIAGAYFGRERLAATLHMTAPGLMVGLAVLLTVMSLQPVLQGVLQGRCLFVWFCAAGILFSLVRLAAGLLLVYGWRPVAAAGLWAQGVGVLAGLLLAAGVIRRTNPPSVPPLTTLTTNPDHYFGATLAALLAFGLLMNADVILVKMFFAQAADFGPYARAATVARTLVFLSQPIVLALFPQVTARADAAPAHRAMLFQALALAGLLIAAVVALCLLWPTGPLWLLFGDRAPTALQQRLVRLLALAMAPTGLVQVLLTFALAQRRFRALWPLAVGAPALILGITWFHQSLPQVAGVLALCTLGTLLGLAGELARPVRYTPPGVRHD